MTREDLSSIASNRPSVFRAVTAFLSYASVAIVAVFLFAAGPTVIALFVTRATYAQETEAKVMEQSTALDATMRSWAKAPLAAPPAPARGEDDLRRPRFPAPAPAPDEARTFPDEPGLEDDLRRPRFPAPAPAPDEARTFPGEPGLPERASPERNVRDPNRQKTVAHEGVDDVAPVHALLSLAVYLVVISFCIGFLGLVVWYVVTKARVLELNQWSGAALMFSSATGVARFVSRLATRLMPLPAAHTVGPLWLLKEVFLHSSLPFGCYSLFVGGVVGLHHLLGFIEEYRFPFKLLAIVETCLFVIGTAIYVGYMLLASLTAFRHLLHGLSWELAQWRGSEAPPNHSPPGSKALNRAMPSQVEEGKGSGQTSSAERCEAND